MKDEFNDRFEKDKQEPGKVESHQQEETEEGVEKRRSKNPETDKEGEFGERLGNDLGYGREGSFIEPHGHPETQGTDFTDRYQKSTYSELDLPDDRALPNDRQGWNPDDEQISQEIFERLVEYGEVDVTDIDVLVENGTVTLSGVVDSEDALRVVDEIRNEVSGVQELHNHLQVRHNREL